MLADLSESYKFKNHQIEIIVLKEFVTYLENYFQELKAKETKT